MATTSPQTNTTQPTPSLHSLPSETTLASEATLVPNQPPQNNNNNNNNNNTTTTQEARDPPRYLYTKRTGPGNPDAKPKEKSKFAKFIAKFQNPAVKQTSAARERERLEEERTGVRVYTPAGAPGSTMQSTGAFM